MKDLDNFDKGDGKQVWLNVFSKTMKTKFWYF
jgi:hypothetical protein